MRKYPDLDKNLAAIVPYYDNNGDHAKIVFSNGSSKIVSFRVKTVIRQLARSQAIDISALRRKIGVSISRSLFQPLPLMPGLVLTPVKVRCPRVSGDSTIAYINYYKITGVKDYSSRPDRWMIELIGAGVLYSLGSAATINRHLVLARLAAAETLGSFSNSPVFYYHNLPQPEINSLAAKLAEIICDIKALKL